MNQPHVCCVMVTTADRSHLARQAIACFNAQLYRNCSMVILDATDRTDPLCDLMNEANTMTLEGGIIAKWDDDDWSHPSRLIEQVSRLTESGKLVTGYSTMPFLDRETGEAFLYRGGPQQVVGASLCYWREAWEQFKFPHVRPESNPRGVGGDSAWVRHWMEKDEVDGSATVSTMIATRHGQTTNKYDMRKRGGFLPAGAELTEWVRRTMADANY